MQSRLTADLIVLLVDDERQTLKYFERAFAKDFNVLTAASADEAEAAVDANIGKIGVVISDQRMPGRSGVSLLNAVRRKHPAIVRMLTTAYSELDDAIEAVNRGEIFRYIVKPWDFDLLRQEINTGLLVYSLQTERDLLIGEKLLARQRMIAVDRARDLAVIIAGLPELHYGPLAVNDYVRDGASSADAAGLTMDAAGLDLWSAPQAEARHMSAVAKQAAATVARLRAAAPGATLDSCVRAAITATAPLASSVKARVTEGSLQPISLKTPAAVIEEIVAAVLGVLVANTPEGGEVAVSASNAAAVNGTQGVNISIRANSRGGPDALLYGSSTRTARVEPGRLFAAYLAARESGGNIKRARGDGVVDIQILLPCEPDKITPPEVHGDWLDKLFQNFEEWPA
jgi:two-component system probable response regulator PhcQ